MVADHVREATDKGRSGPRQGRDLAAAMDDAGIQFVDKAGRRWRSRAYANMVLRTELVDASNKANLAVADQFNAPGVRVRDGGPGDVDEPCRIANGQTWSKEYANLHRYEHPNCRRAFAPLASTFDGTLDRGTAVLEPPVDEAAIDPTELRGDELFEYLTGKKRPDDPHEAFKLMVAIDHDKIDRVHPGAVNRLFLDVEDKWNAEKRRRARESRFRKPEPALYGNSKGAKAGLRDASEIWDQLREEFPDHEPTWNGTLDAYPENENQGYYGAADWDGRMYMAPSGLKPSIRRHVIWHEMLHFFSPGRGSKRHDEMKLYRKMPGWEEAPVEMMARILQDKREPDTVTSKMNANRRRHPYNRYIAPLESWRKEWELGDKESFWREMYSVPFTERFQWLRRKADSLPERERGDYRERLRGIALQMGAKR